MVVKKLNKLLRFQSSAIIATFVDFTVTLFLKEITGLSYLISTASGTITGGIINFILCRNWVFKAAQFPAPRQAFRYAFTWAISILLNITGVYLLTSLAGFNYILSKLVVSSVIGLTFNFSMQRRFVFNMHLKSDRLSDLSIPGEVILPNDQPAVIAVVNPLNQKSKRLKGTNESKR